MAVTIALPANTQIMRDFNTEYGIAQLMLTVYLGVMGCALLVTGYLSDRFGRRPVMITGMFVFALGSLLTAISPSLEALLIGRAVQGLGAATGQSLSRAIIRDLYGRDKAASMIGYITMVTLVAPMLGPMIGGSLTVWMSWRFIFVLLCVLALITALLILRKMPETGGNSMAQKPRFLPSAIILSQHAVFRHYVMSLIFAAGMYWSFQAGAPYLVMEVMQVSPARYGVFFLLTALGYGVGNFLSGRYATQVGTDKMMATAMIPGLLGIALFWVFADTLHPLALFGPMFLVAMSNGLTIPSATAGALSARPELAGTAAGLAGFLQIGTGALLSMLVGFIQNDRFWPMLAVITISGLLSAWVVFRPRRHTTRDDSRC